MFSYRLHRWLAIAVLGVSAAIVCVSSAPAYGQEGRKVKSKVDPVYPELARRMNVSGSVKIQITISPSGSVTNTKVIGGHPLLIEAALDAVKKFKYEPGPSETVQTVEFKFNTAQ